MAVAGRTHFVAVLLYVLLAVWASWPLASHLDGFMLTEEYGDISHSDAGEHMRDAVGIARLLKGESTPSENPEYIWNVPRIDDSFTFFLFGAVMTSAGVTPTQSFNLFFLLSITLSGVFTYFLARELSGGDYVSSILAGGVYMASNYVMHEYVWGHTNLWQIQWIPLAFLCLERTIKYGGFTNPMLLGLVFSVQVYSSTQYATYLSFILVFHLVARAVLCDRCWLKNRRVWHGFFSAAALAIILTCPYALKRIASNPPIRDIDANMAPYFVLNTLTEFLSPGWVFYVGYAPAILALAGSIILIRERKDVRYSGYLPFLPIMIFALSCMFGPYSAYAPYYWLHQFWPAVKYFRVPLRLFPFLLLSISLMMSFVLHYPQAYPKIRRYRLPLAAAALAAWLTQFLLSDYFTTHHIFYE